MCLIRKVKIKYAMNLGYNEHSVLKKNIFWSQMTYINQHGYNEQILAGPELFVKTEFDFISNSFCIATKLSKLNRI